MKRTAAREKAYLLASAKSVAAALKKRARGSAVKVRIPSQVIKGGTDGWRASIGRLDESIQLELWLDRFPGLPTRKLYACMFCEKPTQMSKLIARMPKSLKPVRVITESHILEKEFWRVAVPFSDKEFGAPILETYEGEGTYYGIYDRAGRDSETSIAKSLTRAEEFFELVARAAQGVVAVKKNDRVFPRVENRKAVQKHLTRERAASLARERKVRDNYECQVCGFRFEAIYGDIGSAYAEAHHRVPLSHLKGRVRTTIDDLVTVCANCHRMLHQMEGRKTDVATLRRRIRSSVK